MVELFIVVESFFAYLSYSNETIEGVRVGRFVTELFNKARHTIHSGCQVLLEDLVFFFFAGDRVCE